MARKDRNLRRVASGQSAERAVVLTIFKDGNAEGSLELEPGVHTFGRAHNCDVVLDDVAVSREHARVEISGEGLRLSDSNSTNGIYLEGKRVHEVDIAPGQRVTIRPFELVFELGGEVENTSVGPSPEPGTLHLTPPRAKLEVVEGAKRQEFTLEVGKTLVGRSEKCQLRLAAQAVSRRHAEFELGHGSLKVRDLNSTAGTWVGGKRIEEARLKPGDHVRFGTIVLLIADITGAQEESRESDAGEQSLPPMAPPPEPGVRPAMQPSPSADAPGLRLVPVEEQAPRGAAPAPQRPPVAPPAPPVAKPQRPPQPPQQRQHKGPPSRRPSASLPEIKPPERSVPPPPPARPPAPAAQAPIAPPARPKPPPPPRSPQPSQQDGPILPIPSTPNAETRALPVQAVQAVEAYLDRLGEDGTPSQPSIPVPSMPAAPGTDPYFHPPVAPRAPAPSAGGLRGLEMPPGLEVSLMDGAVPTGKPRTKAIVIGMLVGLVCCVLLIGGLGIYVLRDDPRFQRTAIGKLFVARSGDPAGLIKEDDTASGLDPDEDDDDKPSGADTTADVVAKPAADTDPGDDDAETDVADDTDGQASDIADGEDETDADEPDADADEQIAEADSAADDDRDDDQTEPTAPEPAAADDVDDETKGQIAELKKVVKKAMDEGDFDTAQEALGLLRQLEGGAGADEEPAPEKTPKPAARDKPPAVEDEDEDDEEPPPPPPPPAKKKAPKKAVAKRPSKAQRLFEDGRDLYERGRELAAIKKLRQVAKADRSNRTPYPKRADALISKVKAALESKAAPHVERGLELLADEKYADAIKALRTALKVHPWDTAAKAGMKKVAAATESKVEEFYDDGLMSNQMGQKQEACASWNKGLAISPPGGPFTASLKSEIQKNCK